MRIFELVALVVLAGAGCGRKASPPSPAQACQSTAECAGGFVCLAGQCADARHGAAYVNPGNAITPGKVKREIEQKLAAPERKLDSINAGSE